MRSLLDEIVNYRCELESATQLKIYKSLSNTYSDIRYLLLLYLCTNSIVGGQLGITYKRKNNTGDINFNRTVIDRQSYYTSGMDRKTRYIVKPLEIKEDTWENITDNPEEYIRHAAVVIIDNLDKTVEYIDSNGDPYWYDGVMEGVRKYVNKFLPREYKVKKPTCLLGPQAIEGRGTCADWMVLNIFLSCSGYSTQDIINTILRRAPSEDKLIELIDNWECYLYHTAKTKDLYYVNLLLSNYYRLVDTDEFINIKNQVYNYVNDRDIEGAINLLTDSLRPYDKTTGRITMTTDVQDTALTSIRDMEILRELFKSNNDILMNFIFNGRLKIK